MRDRQCLPQAEIFEFRQHRDRGGLGADEHVAQDIRRNHAAEQQEQAARHPQGVADDDDPNRRRRKGLARTHQAYEDRNREKMLWGGGGEIVSIVADVYRWSPPMHTPNDLNQSRIVLKQDSTLIAVIEMSLSSWLVAGVVPGVERQPLKKLAVDESALLKLLHRWREEAAKAGHRINRIAVARYHMVISVR